MICTVSLAALLFAGLTGTANAADLNYGLKDGVVHTMLWQGRYFGATLGATRTAVDVKGFGNGNNWDVDGSAISGGVLIGYNYRKHNWVGGLEADINASAYKNSKVIGGLGKLSTSSNGYGSLRVRGGYVLDNILLYATGGVAFKHYDIKSSFGGHENAIAVAPVIGIGAEFAVDENWTGRIEALRMNDIEVKGVNLAGANRDVDLGHTVIRVGLTRRF
jgi:outer membrane immunogenic protein